MKQDVAQKSNITEIQNEELWYSPLFRVTLLSRSLASVLFLVLPFIGFYLGVQYEKIATLKLNTSLVTSYEVDIDAEANYPDIEIPKTIHADSPVTLETINFDDVIVLHDIDIFNPVTRVKDNIEWVIDPTATSTYSIIRVYMAPDENKYRYSKVLKIRNHRVWIGSLGSTEVFSILDYRDLLINNGWTEELDYKSTTLQGSSSSGDSFGVYGLFKIEDNLLKTLVLKVRTEAENPECLLIDPGPDEMYSNTCQFRQDYWLGIGVISIDSLLQSL